MDLNVYLAELRRAGSAPIAGPAPPGPRSPLYRSPHVHREAMRRLSGPVDRPGRRAVTPSGPGRPDTAQALTRKDYRQ